MPWFGTDPACFAPPQSVRPELPYATAPSPGEIMFNSPNVAQRFEALPCRLVIIAQSNHASDWLVTLPVASALARLWVMDEL